MAKVCPSFKGFTMKTIQVYDLGSLCALCLDKVRRGPYLLAYCVNGAIQWEQEFHNRKEALEYMELTRKSLVKELS